MPDWVPSGTLSLALPPSSVGTSIVAPSAACATLDRHLADQVRAVALEEGVLRHAQHHVEVARGAAERPGSPSPPMRSWLPASTPAGILIWSVLLDGTLPLAAGSVVQRLGHDPARAAAVAAGARDGEEALLERDLARAAAGGAGVGLRPRRRAAAGAGPRSARRGGSGCCVSVPNAASSKAISRL